MREWPCRASLPAQVAFGAGLGEATFQGVNVPIDFLAVEFELRLPWTTRPDPATEAGECAPPTAQPWEEVAQLGKFHLQPRLLGRRSLGEDVHDQLRAVDYLPLDRLFQVACLGRRELVVTDDHIRSQLTRCCLDLAYLSLPDEGGGIAAQALLCEDS